MCNGRRAGLRCGHGVAHLEALGLPRSQREARLVIITPAVHDTAVERAVGIGLSRQVRQSCGDEGAHHDARCRGRAGIPRRYGVSERAPRSDGRGRDILGQDQLPGSGGCSAALGGGPRRTRALLACTDTATTGRHLNRIRGLSCEEREDGSEEGPEREPVGWSGRRRTRTCPTNFHSTSGGAAISARNISIIALLATFESTVAADGNRRGSAGLHIYFVGCAGIHIPAGARLLTVDANRPRITTPAGITRSDAFAITAAIRA